MINVIDTSVARNLIFLIPLMEYMISIIDFIDTSESIQRHRSSPMVMRTAKTVEIVNFLALISDLCIKIIDSELKLKIHLLIKYVNNYK